MFSHPVYDTFYEFWSILYRYETQEASYLHPHDRLEPIALPDRVDARLYHASLMGLTELSRWLVQEGVDVNSPCAARFRYPLVAAAAAGEEATVDLLLDIGADLNATDLFGRTALDEAASYSRNDDTVRLLLDRGARIDGHNGPNTSPLSFAIQAGTESVIRLLVGRGADLNRKGLPLLQASQFGQLNVFQILLENGANIKSIDNSREPILPSAVCSGNENLVRLLIQNGANVNLKSRFLGDALRVAIKRRALEMVQLLLENGANVNASCGLRSCHLLVAIFQNSLEIAQLLLDNGANVNASNCNCCPPLKAAVLQNSLEMVELLLDNGADINANDGEYGCILQVAIASPWTDQESDRMRMVELLLERGADVDIEGGEHGSHLRAAKRFLRGNVVRLLSGDVAQSEDGTGSDVSSSDWTKSSDDDELEWNIL